MESKVTFSVATTFVVAYFTFCGALWHLGYWSTFKFNFLEYASLTDLFKSTVYPFFSSIWIFVCLMIFITCLLILAPWGIRSKNKKAEFASAEFDEFLNEKPAKVMIDISISLSAFITACYTIFTHSHDSVGFLPLSIGFFVGLLLYRLSLIKSYVKGNSFRLILILSLSLYASYNFWKAKSKAMEIDSLFKYQSVFSIDTGDSLVNKQIQDLPYLGYTDKHMFFLLSDKVIVLKSDLVKQIVIEPKMVDSNYHYFLDRHPF